MARQSPSRNRWRSTPSVMSIAPSSTHTCWCTRMSRTFMDALVAERPGWAAADSFGDNNPVTFGIRDHALVVSVARPSWPIEKREPVALQSLCQGVDRGPRAQLHPKVCVPNELARARRIWNPLDVRSVCISSNRPPPGNVRKYEVNLFRSVSYFRFDRASKYFS